MDCMGIGSVCQGQVGVDLVTPEPGGRGTARVELSVHGARYPYKLSVVEARALAKSLLDAANQLAGLPLPTPTDGSVRPLRKRVRYPKFVPAPRPAELIADLFALRDGEGNVWSLSAAKNPRWTDLTLEASSVLIEGKAYDVRGCFWLYDDGTHGNYSGWLRVSVWPTGHRFAGTPVPRWIINRAEARLHVLLGSEAAAAILPRAMAIGALPRKERQQIQADTRLALANAEELQAHIQCLKEWLEPDGGANSAAARIEIEIASIRPNSSRHRRRIAELREQLQRIDAGRAERQLELAKYEARLAGIAKS